MRKPLFTVCIILLLPVFGFTQGKGENTPNRLTLVPVEHNRTSNATILENEENNQTVEEKIRQLEEKISSIQSKIEVLESEGAESNAAEITEKRKALENYRLELNALKEN